MIHALAVRVVSATPSPTPSGELDPSSVSPGLVGFLATFAIVLATVVLMLDLVRRLRRMRFRQERAAAAERDHQRDLGTDGPS